MQGWGHNIAVTAWDYTHVGTDTDVSVAKAALVMQAGINVNEASSMSTQAQQNYAAKQFFGQDAAGSDCLNCPRLVINITSKKDPAIWLPRTHTRTQATTSSPVSINRPLIKLKNYDSPTPAGTNEKKHRYKKEISP